MAPLVRKGQCMLHPVHTAGGKWSALGVNPFEENLESRALGRFRDAAEQGMVRKGVGESGRPAGDLLLQTLQPGVLILSWLPRSFELNHLIHPVRKTLLGG